jgi:maleate cis-trans isomerase
MVYVDGWRGRIGLITPSPGSSTEAEFNRYRPEGVAVLTTRIPLLGISKRALDEMNSYLDKAASLLITAEVDAIVFGCTAGSLISGLGWDKKIIERLTRLTGTKVTTTSSGVLEALGALKVKKVAVATPYSLEVNEAEKAFLDGSGFKVTSIIGPLLTDPKLVPQIAPGEMYRMARKADTDDADAMFISCTGLHVLGIIDMLEKDLGKPVITSNQVSLWSALKKLNIHEKIEGLGKLFTL